MKNCSKCHQNKQLEDFAKLKSRKSGIAAICKCCHNNSIKEFRKKHPNYSRNSNLLKNYGITSEEFDVMLAEQHNTCKVCSGPPLGKGRYHVDHCHKTGKVRGLLCHKCNVALGMVQDNAEHLLTLVSYLERTS